MEFFHKLFHLLFGGLYNKILKRNWDHSGGLNDSACWNDLIGHIGQTNIYVVLFLIVFIVLPAANVFAQALSKGREAYIRVLVPREPADLKALPFATRCVDCQAATERLAQAA